MHVVGSYQPAHHKLSQRIGTVAGRGHAACLPAAVLGMLCVHASLYVPGGTRHQDDAEHMHSALCAAQGAPSLMGQLV